MVGSGLVGCGSYSFKLISEMFRRSLHVMRGAIRAVSAIEMVFYYFSTSIKLLYNPFIPFIPFLYTIYMILFFHFNKASV